ncbi:MAG: phosphatase 2C-like domain-containing protein [Monoraphidium minutum]|nr:MAG: phosphatase 2C-like domain-containing protein [Monoraphidium minutum]
MGTPPAFIQDNHTPLKASKNCRVPARDLVSPPELRCFIYSTETVGRGEAAAVTLTGPCYRRLLPNVAHGRRWPMMLANGTTVPRTAPTDVTSGGEARSDGGASFGFALLRGKRPHQEDFATAQARGGGALAWLGGRARFAAWQHVPGGAAGEQVGLFGVFDGHGGPNAADYVHGRLFSNLLRNEKFGTDAVAAITEAFEQTDSEYLMQHSEAVRDDGCTAITAVLLGKRLLVANAGDSRAVLSRAGKAVALSVDHKPNLREERLRIEDAGGVVVWAGTWRVSGVLAVSRAFGDRPLKRFVIPTPDVREEVLGARDEAVILASDGVWDEVVTLVHGIPDAQRAVRRLVEEAYTRGSLDNISAVVLKLRP